jgi:hypothetical protein
MTAANVNGTLYIFGGSARLQSLTGTDFPRWTSNYGKRADGQYLE